MNKNLFAFCFAVFFLCAQGILAAIRLPSIFGDGMVLQQEQPVAVWGWAEPGETLSVAFAGRNEIVTANQRGEWRAILSPMRWDDTPQTLWVKGEEDQVAVDNVLIGEVWLCSGQSNMDMAVSGEIEEFAWRKGALNYKEEIANADYPNMRLFAVERMSAPRGPREDLQGDWVKCRPETVGTFSAVGYFFGRQLHRQLRIPVGLVKSSYGGTQVEAWMSKSALQSLPAGRETLAAWETKQENAPQKTRQNKNYPSSLYNAMIAPLIPFSLRGVIWYQGESNAGRAAQYKQLFPAMIEDWRGRWGMGDFPFYYVQLAAFDTTGKRNPDDWPRLRQAQLETLELDNTGMAVAIDIGDANDIHPRNKQEVGRRLALWALAKPYGHDFTPSGPLAQSARQGNGNVRVSFNYTSGGLEFRGSHVSSFELANVNGKFHRAKARIEGDAVVVWHDRIPHPTAVRYAWKDVPTGVMLYNGAGLPASPFRLDVEE